MWSTKPTVLFMIITFNVIVNVCDEVLSYLNEYLGVVGRRLGVKTIYRSVMVRMEVFNILIAGTKVVMVSVAAM